MSELHKALKRAKTKDWSMKKDFKAPLKTQNNISYTRIDNQDCSVKRDTRSKYQRDNEKI
jgi:hypothetical protein